MMYTSNEGKIAVSPPNVGPLLKPKLVSRMHSDADAMLAAAHTLLELTPSHPQQPVQRFWQPQQTVLVKPLPTPSLADMPRSVCVSYTEDSSSSDDDDQSDFTSDCYYSGTVSLSLDSDEESLSPIHCFMRKYCVEVFTACEADVAGPRVPAGQYAHRVSVNQVGIRCMHCKNRPYHQRQERSVCFPSSLKNIYHSIETWQRRHSLVCQDIPDWIKKTMISMMEMSKTGAGGRRKYWEESAMQLGMATTSQGIRFIRPPGQLKELPKSAPAALQTDGHPVVQTADKDLVTDYLFLLLDQMETCSFTEEDRSGGRSKVKSCAVGHPGIQCKHCAGKAGFGRYFPTTCQALTSANSDRNIHNHLTKCRRCPPEVQQQLKQLQMEQQSCKNRRGSRKQFFQQIWDRLHGISN